MSKPDFELADILRTHRKDLETAHPQPQHHRQVLTAIENCRTAYFGGHVERCDRCSHIRISYNSCRNRHCPKCQNTNREQWIEDRKQDLMPVPYFHVVFTLPDDLNALCLQFPAEIYNILFAAGKETVETFAADPKHLGAKPGMIAILHTWGQNLSLHPHVHMIVPGGGMTEAGYWKHTRASGQFLFPVKAMSIVYKNKFMEKFRQFHQKEGIPLDSRLRADLYRKTWNVYAKHPFAGPEQVIEYLGRYTHKIAISNHRITRFSNGNVSFRYKDYKHGGIQKEMTLSAIEFLRRFCLHILPHGFRKIRHFGILAARNKPALRVHRFMQFGMIAVIKPKMNWKTLAQQKLNFDADTCPCCKTGKMIRLLSFDNKPPPDILKALTIQQTNIA